MATQLLKQGPDEKDIVKVYWSGEFVKSGTIGELITEPASPPFEHGLREALRNTAGGDCTAECRMPKGLNDRRSRQRELLSWGHPI